jgi:hypothetical protein
MVWAVDSRWDRQVDVWWDRWWAIAVGRKIQWVREYSGRVPMNMGGKQIG